MPRINLLPWRAELREKRKKDFLTAIMAALLFGGLGVYGAKLTVKSWTAAQNNRNNILKAEIATLEQQIAEIDTLEEQKNNLLERMEVVAQLQISRPDVVRLFDQVVNVMPPGLYLTSIKQQGTRIAFEGGAESNSRVSDFLRNIAASEFLWDPNVPTITANDTTQDNKFTASASQVTAQSRPSEATP